MRFFVLLLFAVYCHSCQAQNREVKRIDLKLDIPALEKNGAILGKARLLAVDGNFAIGQIGIVDIILFDLRSGNIIKSLDIDSLIKSLEEHIHCLLGNHYYVPDNKENLRSRFVGVLPYDFRGLLFHEEKGKFVTHMVTTVFNRNDESEQLLFPSLVFFDKNLDNIEILPFDPLNRSTNSDWSNGGFFLGRDRMYTKIMAWSHKHDFDFLEYRLTDDQLYTLVDTLFGIKTDTLGYVGRFHGSFVFSNRNYINLGSMLYSFEMGKRKEGTLVRFPHKVKRNIVHIEPIDENHLVAYAINNYRFDPNPTGWLLLLDKDLAILREIHAFDLRKITFCSLFLSGKSVYVVNYDGKKENYFLLRYDNF